MDKNFITVTPDTGSGNGSLSVSCAANTGASRNETINISGGGVTKTVNVTQEAASIAGKTVDVQVGHSVFRGQVSSDAVDGTNRVISINLNTVMNVYPQSGYLGKVGIMSIDGVATTPDVLPTLTRCHRSTSSTMIDLTPVTNQSSYLFKATNDSDKVVIDLEGIEGPLYPNVTDFTLRGDGIVINLNWKNSAWEAVNVCGSVFAQAYAKQEAGKRLYYLGAVNFEPYINYRRASAGAFQTLYTVTLGNEQFPMNTPPDNYTNDQISWPVGNQSDPQEMANLTLAAGTTSTTPMPLQIVAQGGQDRYTLFHF